MKTIQEQLPQKHKLFKLYLKGGDKVLCEAFEGGSGVYHIETDNFNDDRYWCEGELKPGHSLDDIMNCKWEYV